MSLVESLFFVTCLTLSAALWADSRAVPDPQAVSFLLPAEYVMLTWSSYAG